jgi:hypothetical protein
MPEIAPVAAVVGRVIAAQRIGAADRKPVLAAAKASAKKCHRGR